MQSMMNFSQIIDLGQHLPLRGKVLLTGRTEILYTYSCSGRQDNREQL